MGSTYLSVNNGDRVIGDDCSLNTDVQLGGQGAIRIGNDVLIGPNVVLRATDHTMTLGHPTRLQVHRRATIIVEDGVWIATNAVVPSDVTLGEGCVVGAGAFVMREVPAFAILGGNPAVIIEQRR